MRAYVDQEQLTSSPTYSNEGSIRLQKPLSLSQTGQRYCMPYKIDAVYTCWVADPF